MTHQLVALLGVLAIIFGIIYVGCSWINGRCPVCGKLLWIGRKKKLAEIVAGEFFLDGHAKCVDKKRKEEYGTTKPNTTETFIDRMMGNDDDD